MNPSGGDNEEQFSLVLTTEGADQSLNQINAVQDALAGVDEQTQLLTASSQSLADILSSPDAAQQLGLTTDELAQLAEQLGVTIDTGALLPPVFDDTDTSVKNLIRDIGDLGRDIEAIPQPDLSAFGGAGDGSGDDSGGGISPRLFSTAGRLVGGGAGRALRGVGQVSRLADSLPEDTSALVELGSAGLIAAPAIIAAGAALQNYNDEMAENKQRLDAALSAQDAYYQALATDTSTQAKNEIDAKQKEQDTLQQQIAETQNALASGWKQINDALPAQQDDAFNPLGDVVGLAEGGLRSLAGNNLGDLQTKLDGLNKTFQENADTIARLKEGLGSGAFSAADLNTVLHTLVNDGMTVWQDAIKKLDEQLAQEQVVKQAQQDLNSQLSSHQVDQAQAAIAVQQMTQQQRAAQIQQDLEAEAVLHAEMGQAGLTSDAHKQLIEQYQGLETEVTLLSGTTNTYADQQAQLAANTKAVSDQTTNYETALANEGKIRDQITADTQELNDERSAAAAQQQTDYADEQTKLAQISTDGSQKQQQIAQDNAAAIAKINSQAGQDELNDIGDRDANAYRLAEQKQQTDLTDQQANDKKQSDQANFQFAAQRATTQDDYNKELTQLQTALASKEQVTDQHLAQDQVNLTNTLNDETQLAINGAGLQRVIHTQAWTDIATITANGLTDLENRFVSFFQRANAIAGLPITSNGNPNETPLNANINNAVLQVLDNVLPSASNGQSGNRLIP